MRIKECFYLCRYIYDNVIYLMSVLQTHDEMVNLNIRTSHSLVCRQSFGAITTVYRTELGKTFVLDNIVLFEKNELLLQIMEDNYFYQVS